MSLRRDFSATTFLGDVIAVAVVVLLGVLPFPNDEFRAQGLLLIPALLPAAMMPLRRRSPLLVLGASMACDIALAVGGVVGPSTLMAIAIAAFAVTDRIPRVWAFPAVGAAAVVVFTTNAVVLHGELFDSRAMQFLAFILVGAAFGAATRSRREYATAMTERAERAERTREEVARRRVAEDRVRIARDLHDVVAHQISVISLNAGVASSAMDTRPDRAREALSTIRDSARTVLTDIGGLMTLLRSEGADASTALHPSPGLAQLPGLIARFSADGLAVELIGDPSGVALSPATDRVAYLAMQEGLTNALKHGDTGRAVIGVDTDGRSLTLTVRNILSSRLVTPPASGHGLQGLRERVVAVRGRVESREHDGAYELTVSLPIEMEGAG